VSIVAMIATAKMAVAKVANTVFNSLAHL